MYKSMKDTYNTSGLRAFRPVHQDASYDSELAQVVLTGTFGGTSNRSLSHGLPLSSVASGSGYFRLGHAYSDPKTYSEGYSCESFTVGRPSQRQPAVQRRM